jgi:hypothetical protein
VFAPALLQALLQADSRGGATGEARAACVFAGKHLLLFYSGTADRPSMHSVPSERGPDWVLQPARRGGAHVSYGRDVDDAPRESNPRVATVGPIRSVYRHPQKVGYAHSDIKRGRGMPRIPVR